MRWLVVGAIGLVWLLAVAPVRGQDGDATDNGPADPAELRTTVIFSAQRLANGHTVLVLGYALDDAEVVEIDAAGRIRWRYSDAAGRGLAWTHSAQYRPDTDTFLIADTGHNRVIEVTRAGEIIWSFTRDGLDYPNDADRLPNGHTLITVRDGHLLVEVDGDGEVVWTSDAVKGPHNADRLANGHTLVADSGGNRVLELDADERVVWQYADGLAWPRDADRLTGDFAGRTLIVDTGNGRVLEVDGHGEIAWQYRDAPMAYDADRLANGHTLITTNGYPRARLLEVDRAGRVVWSWQAPVSRFDRGGLVYLRDARPAVLRDEALALLHELRKRGTSFDALQPAAELLNENRRLEAVTWLHRMRAGTDGEPAPVNGRIEGRVTTGDGRALAGATVLLADTRRVATTTDDGAFAFDHLLAGDYWLVVRADGFVDRHRRIPATGDEPVALGDIALTATDDAEAWRGEYLRLSVGYAVPATGTDPVTPLSVGWSPRLFGRTRTAVHPARDDAAVAESLANLRQRGQLLHSPLPVPDARVGLWESRATVALADLAAGQPVEFRLAVPADVEPVIWTSHPQWHAETTRDGDDFVVRFRVR